MTDRAIQVGDLVQVVRWPCCGASLGQIFKVEEMWSPGGTPQCKSCKATVHEPFPFPAGIGIKGAAAPRAWLKRIPPLDELEGAQEWRYITNPKELV